MMSAPRLFACALLASFAIAQQPTAPTRSDSLQLPDDPFAALAAMPSEAPVRGGLEVVVRDADGAAVPEAIVVLLSSKEGDHAAVRNAAEQRYPGDEPRILAARATRGVRYAVSAQGTTRVPIDIRGRVVAVHGGLLASVIRDQVGAAAARRVELQLQPPQRFTVEVVTADGAPANGVVLGLLAAPGEFAFPKQLSGPDGKADFVVTSGRGERAVVQALIAADSLPSAPLPTVQRSAETAATRLTLPQCGSITARLDDEPLPGADVTWTLRNGQGLTVRPSATPGSGEARFEHVAVGFHGVLACSIDGEQVGGDDGGGVPFAALTAGEHREVVVATAGRREVVVQLLMPDGEPLRGCWVLTRWQYANGSQSSAARTNREGWLRLAADASIAAPAKLRLEAHRENWRGPLLGATDIEIGELQAGRNRFAPQRLTAPTIALTGRAVDANGRPPTGLQLQARREDDHQDQELQVDADGRFAVWLIAPHPQRVAIAVDSDEWSFVDHPGQPQLYERGAEVQLRVQRRGRVRFSQQGLPDDLHSTFDSYWERAEDRERVDVELATDSGLLTAPPGTWSLVIAYGDQEVHRIEDVTIASGIETHDARLMFFDWQSFAAAASIRVLDEQGKPFDACTVWYHYGNGATGTSPDAGLSRWLVPKRGAHMTVEPDNGHAEIDLGMVSGGDLVVRLGKGPRLLLALSGLPTLPAGATLVAAAEGQDVWQPVAADGTAELWAEAVGGCRPRLAVQKGEQRVEVQFRLPRAELPRGGTRLEVTADEALTTAVAAAAAGLR